MSAQVIRELEEFFHPCDERSDKKYQHVYGSRHRDGTISWRAKSFAEEVRVRFCPYCGLDLIQATREAADGE